MSEFTDGERSTILRACAAVLESLPATAGRCSTQGGGDNARPGGRNYLSLVPREGSPLNGGDNARPVAGDGEDLTDGDDSELIGGHDSELIAGNYSWLVARDAATLVAGDGSTLIGGIGTTFTAGVRSTFVVLWWDAQACRCRVLIGEVGEGGLEPGVLYRCEKGRWVAGAWDEP